MDDHTPERMRHPSATPESGEPPVCPFCQAHYSRAVNMACRACVADGIACYACRRDYAVKGRELCAPCMMDEAEMKGDYDR